MTVPRVAYLTNRYPAVSHSFIRREILALEAQGLEVVRFASRGWDEPVPDGRDQAEVARTRYLMQAGVGQLLKATAAAFVSRPGAFLRSLALAMRCARRSQRPWPVHLAYLVQACLLKQWLDDARIGHVHCHFGTNPTEVAMLVESLGGPGFSFTVHGPEEFDRPEALCLGEKIRRARFVVGVSSFGRSQLFRWADAASWSRIKVVRCGLDQAFRELGDAKPVNPACRLVCVGRLCAQKGQLLLVEALARLAREGLHPELVFAGDGDMRAAVTEAVQRAGLQSQVRFTGWISNEQVRDEILAARALVLPSFAEGLPVVLMEAMALRRPVITTCVAGIPELVEPGHSGWLVPAGDIDALTAAIRECLTAEPQVLQEMGERGRQRALERHDVEREARGLLQLFAAHVGIARPAMGPQRSIGVTQP
jgi:colanic acid/amylovoran biosynthesis glycosyltransferase